MCGARRSKCVCVCVPRLLLSGEARAKSRLALSNRANFMSWHSISCSRGRTLVGRALPPNAGLQSDRLPDIHGKAEAVLLEERAPGELRVVGERGLSSGRGLPSVGEVSDESGFDSSACRLYEESLKRWPQIDPFRGPELVIAWFVPTCGSFLKSVCHRDVIVWIFDSISCVMRVTLLLVIKIIAWSSAST